MCEDYDLCIPCHVGLKHGHQPSHAFAPACEDTKLDLMATKLLAAGRNMRHFAICDGCDKVSDNLFDICRRILTDVGHLWYSPQMPEVPRLGLLL